MLLQINYPVAILGDRQFFKNDLNLIDFFHI